MQVDDFRINAAVRTLLIRHWIDTSQCDHGTLNGIVYLRGTLQKELVRENGEPVNEESIRLLVIRLERQIRSIRGVRDIICTLANVAKVKGQWVARTAQA